ncbi:hypothetical protein BKA70DRAFT_1481733 [Coprinopsis sp. MPI-PUGE-AT-0042]|nr:hypothetical protein BKA70DRAFT_1481733 [Coprinopsis sp. MPI-PUGE-AT-0042]
MFPVDNGTDGQSDKHPIVLKGYTSRDFNALLKILVPKHVASPLDPSSPHLTKEAWISVLKLSTVWQMDKIRTMAIQRLSSMSLLPLDTIVMARELRVSNWLSEGATSLIGILDSFNIGNIAQVLGWEKTARLYALYSTPQNSILEKETKELRGSLNQSVHVTRLQCIGCNKAPVSTQSISKGCVCGGHKYEEVGPPIGFGFSSAQKRISGHRVIEDWASLLPTSTTSTNPKSAISATVTKLFGAEIEAMKVEV